MNFSISDKEKREWLLANGYGTVLVGETVLFTKNGARYTINAAFIHLIKEILETRQLYTVPPAPGGIDKQFQYNNGGILGGYLDQYPTPFANPCPIDCRISRNHLVLIDGDTTINLTYHTAGMSGIIVLYNTTGAHTVLWGAAFTKELRGSDDYDATASKYNLLSWYYDGVNVIYSNTKEA